MIDHKSLRIGNLVLWGDKEARITNLGMSPLPNYVNPIPLTDEVLIRAGFTKDQKWNYFSKTWGQFGCVLVKYQPVHEKFCVTNSTNAFSNWIPCEHLHTLQNAWHLFTEGTELEIK